MNYSYKLIAEDLMAQIYKRFSC